MACLWFCFSGIVQAEFDEVRGSWNDHYIHSSHYHIYGIPGILYPLLESTDIKDHKKAFNINDLPEKENELGGFDWDGIVKVMKRLKYFSMIFNLLNL